MYERILAAVDESDVADRVLAAATELAALSHGEVFVLHLREREPTKFGVIPSIESPGDAESLVDDAVQKLTAAGVKAAGTARNRCSAMPRREIHRRGGQPRRGRDRDGVTRPR